MKKLMATALSALALTACTSQGEKESGIIDKPDFKSESGIFDLEALEALGRVSAVSVSPDSYTHLLSHETLIELL